MNDEEIKQITDYIDTECYIVNSIIKTYEKCLKKYLYQKRYKQAISYSKKDTISITNINGIPLSHIDKDEFEVYIKKV